MATDHHRYARVVFVHSTIISALCDDNSLLSLIYIICHLL